MALREARALEQRARGGAAPPPAQEAVPRGGAGRSSTARPHRAKHAVFTLLRPCAVSLGSLLTRPIHLHGTTQLRGRCCSCSSPPHTHPGGPPRTVSSPILWKTSDGLARSRGAAGLCWQARWAMFVWRTFNVTPAVGAVSGVASIMHRLKDYGHRHAAASINRTPWTTCAASGCRRCHPWSCVPRGS